MIMKSLFSVMAGALLSKSSKDKELVESVQKAGWLDIVKHGLGLRQISQPDRHAPGAGNRPQVPGDVGFSNGLGRHCPADICTRRAFVAGFLEDSDISGARNARARRVGVDGMVYPSNHGRTEGSIRASADVLVDGAMLALGNDLHGRDRNAVWKRAFAAWDQGWVLWNQASSVERTLAGNVPLLRL